MTEDIHETYQRDGLGPAMAKLIAFRSLRGPTPPDLPNRAPNPADVGLPAEDDAAGTTRCWARTWSGSAATSPTSTPRTGPPADRRRGRRGVRGHVSLPRRAGRGAATWDRGGDLSEPPRRVRPAGRSGRVRRHPSPGPHGRRLTDRLRASNGGPSSLGSSAAHGPLSISHSVEQLRVDPFAAYLPASGRLHSGWHVPALDDNRASCGGGALRRPDSAARRRGCRTNEPRCADRPTRATGRRNRPHRRRSESLASIAATDLT